MRLALALAVFALAAPSLAGAQSSDAELEAELVAPVIADEGERDDFATQGDYGFGFGRPTTFDTLRLDVRESLRPPQTFGPGSSPDCSPSTPDC